MTSTLFGPFIQTHYPYSNPLDGGARFGNQPAMSNLLGTSQLPPPSTVARAFVDAFPYFRENLVLSRGQRLSMLPIVYRPVIRITIK